MCTCLTVRFLVRMLNKKIPAGREFFYATIDVCDEFTASQTNIILTARVNDDFVARNNYLCYNLCSELVEDPCRKGLSFMKKPNVKVLTIAVDNHFVFQEALENWLSGGAEILSIGYNNANSDSYAGWYAIAKIPANIKTTWLLIKPSEYSETWNVEGIDLGKEE